MIVKNKLIVLRKQKQLTQEEVSKAIGCSKSYYCNLERSKRNPSLKVLKKLAKYFNTTIDDLLEQDVK